TYVPPGGFPWVLLGYSQVTTLPIAQLASLVGVYGVSALVAGVSSVAAFCVAPTSRQGRSRLTAVMMMALTILALAIWGSRRVARSDWTRAGEPLQVGLVQGNVDQAQKWNGARSTSIFKDYLRMTRQAIGNGAEIVLWPESSTPFMFEEDHPAAEQVRTLARQARVSILLGS